VLVAGVSAGVLALGSFLLVRQTRLQDSLDRARAEAGRDLALAFGTRFPDPQGFVSGYEARGVHAILVIRGHRFASSSSVSPPIPPALQQLVQRGDLGYQRLAVQGAHYLMVGGPAPRADAQLYFLFSEQRLQHDLAQLGLVLGGGWLLVVLLAGLVGRSLARRTLEPVAKASQAARSMAEGLLATRLPVEAEDEFGGWAASFNEMAEALESKITALSEAQARERRFVADVSHELRTPLTALVGEASLLREHLDRMPPEARRPAELLIQDVARLRKLVGELMEISRLDAGEEAVRAEPIDLAEVARAVVRGRGWEAEVRIEGDGVILPTDRRRLERVVANLVGNAVEHGGQEVGVRIGRTASMAFVEVSDHGRGIPPEHLPHLFERFYKADPSRSGAGSGLGLAIAAENARLLGGSIDVWSELGAGSRFTLLIPVTEPLPGGDGPETGGLDHEAQSRARGGTT
jgi:signal transduction histidine kinase